MLSGILSCGLFLSGVFMIALRKLNIIRVYFYKDNYKIRIYIFFFLGGGVKKCIPNYNQHMLEYPNEQINASYEGYKDYINRIDSLAYSGGGGRPPLPECHKFCVKR